MKSISEKGEDLDLREVLRQARATLQRENETADGAICDTIWHTDSQTLFDYLDSALQATAVEPKDITRDLSMMLQRLVVAIRKHAPEDSQLKHLGNLAWALLHDRGLSGSITRNTNTQGACDG